MELISVIVPVYNTALYLPECVESILAQTYENLELLLIDDGSTDGSGRLCDGFAARDPRVRVIHQRNRGLSAARNAGLDLSRGAYIAFADSDDWMERDMLARLYGTLQQTGADMALCGVRQTSGEETTMEDALLTREAFRDCLLQPEAWYYITVWNKLCRRELWEDLRFPVGYIHEDEAVIYDLAVRCHGIALVSASLYHYRRHPGSIMAGGGTIASTDKLLGIARRIELSRELGWKAAWEANCFRFSQVFLEYYTAWPREANLGYFRRMEAQLARALPDLLRCRRVWLRHKLYLLLIRWSPAVFLALRKQKRRF